jgi:subtilisin family serine protease
MGRHWNALLATAVLVAGAPLIGVGAVGPATAAPSDGATASYIVVLRDGVARDSIITRQQHSLGIQARQRYSSVLNGYAAQLTPRQAQALSVDVSVLFVSPSRRFLTDPPGPGMTNPPCPDVTQCQIVVRAARRVDAQNSSAYSGNHTGSVPVNVAVIDTGSEPSTDLNVVGGVDCVGDGRGPVADPNGHGTGVAGVLGALDNDAFVVGIAPGARIYSVRVLDQDGFAEDPQVLCGLDWVAATHRDADPTNDIAVANMSLGGPGRDDGKCGLKAHDAVHVAICGLAAAGVTVVAGSANDAASVESDIPGGYREVLTSTGMSDGDGTWGGLTPDPCDGYEDDAYAPFSNYATSPLSRTHIVSAPAVCVSTLAPSSAPPVPGVAVWDGTSFAAPSVSGVVALCIWSGNCARMSPQQIVQKIVLDANLNTLRYPNYGFYGDPLDPVLRKYYGPLIRASLY